MTRATLWHYAKVALQLWGALVVAAVALFVAVLVFVEHPHHARIRPFEFLEALAIEKTSPKGVNYTVNNSTATFHLDVAGEDPHCRKLFRDYASVLGYCRSEGLPVVPSVQMVQGKCKQFDDGLCAALELAVQEGLPQEDFVGKREALSRLLQKLLSAHDEATGDAKRVIEHAVVHVAAAAELGGTEIELDPGMAAKVGRSKDSFFTKAVRSRPIGFWTWSEELRRLFRQDRCLMKGLGVAGETAECIVLAATISGDEELSGAFRRFKEFDAGLTNPLTYIDPDEVLSVPARLISFEDVAVLLPAEAPLAQLLEAEAAGKVRKELVRRFGKDAGLALVAYSESKEYDLLLRLLGEGKLSGAEETMPLIIDAVRSGRLSLEPRPDSGWYDYQWYALETLLLPERARESAKLKLSEAYKERLENAFRTSLTKMRETHIKHLPVVLLCATMGEPPKPPKVEIGPEFCAEPTATVYLRLGRGYRFLRNAMRAVLGEESLKRLHRRNESSPPVKVDLDDELRRMALLCYGLYERICLEVGQLPKYLSDEMTAEDTEAAKAEVSRWLSSLDTDADLARDTRVAVPIMCWPGGPVRYWATGGVRLERVVYEYEEEPAVGGFVEPVFVPKHYYLPTDIFLEFARPSGVPLTREEFRALCDGHEDEDSLRSALGAGPRRRRGSSVLRVLGYAALLLAGGAVLAACYVFRAKLRGIKPHALRLRPYLKYVLLAVGLLVALWIVALVVSPYYRTRFKVRYVARASAYFNVPCDVFLYPQDPTERSIQALADLLADPNPQVRYLAATILSCSWRFGDDKGLFRRPEVEKAVRAAAEDELVEVASRALMMMGSFPGQDNVDFLLSKLEESGDVDAICDRALFALGQIGDARVLEAVFPFTRDPRPAIRGEAIRSLGGYKEARAARRLAELVQSPEERTSMAARAGIGRLLRDSPHPPWEDEFNEALLNAARNASFTARHRMDLAERITETEPRVQAYVSLLESPSPDESGMYVRNVTWALARIGPAAAAAVPALKKALEHSDPRVREAAAQALEKIGAE